MPRNGPATPKDVPTPVATPSDTPEDVSTDRKASEGTEEPAEIPKPPEVKTPSKDRKAELIKLYPEGTELWFAEIDGLVFALPRITNINPPRQWLRAIYQLTELAQSFEWMALAKVPDVIQAQTDLLTDDQYQALVRGWYTDTEIELPK
jgi:hypothetical protein